MKSHRLTGSSFTFECLLPNAPRDGLGLVYNADKEYAIRIIAAPFFEDGFESGDSSAWNSKPASDSAAGRHYRLGPKSPIGGGQDLGATGELRR